MSELSKKRMEICRKCVYLIPKVEICRACGCVMYAKSKIRWAVCPKGKWNNIKNED